jgi:hypothetical protein
MNTRTTWTAEALVKIIWSNGGQVSELSALGLGWTDAEIKRYVRAGTIRRIGNQMGAGTSYYLRAAC